MRGGDSRVLPSNSHRNQKAAEEAGILGLRCPRAGGAVGREGPWGGRGHGPHHTQCSASTFLFLHPTAGEHGVF